MAFLRTYCASGALLLSLSATSALADPDIDANEALPTKTLVARARTTLGLAGFTLQETDCVYEYLRVTVTRSKTLYTPNDPEKLKSTLIEYEYDDVCTPGQSHTIRGALTIAPSKADVPLTLESMSTGRVKVDFPIHDCIIKGMSPDLIQCQDTTRKLDITVDWTPVGELERNVSRSKSSQGDHWEISRSVTLYTLAVSTLDGKFGGRTLEEIDDTVTSNLSDSSYAIWTEPR